MKICIASSAGGHLTEVLQLRKAYEKFPHFYIIVKRDDSAWLEKSKKVYYVEDVRRNARAFVKNFKKSLEILKKEKPDILISTGAGGAMPSIVAAKFLGIKIIFIESLARVKNLSSTGKFIYPIADLFLVQWPELAKGKAKFWGAVV